MSNQNEGRFQKGKSGNPRGRPRKARPTLESEADMNDMVIEVMNMPAIVTTPQGEITVSLIHRAVMGLATGSVKNRLAATSTIDLMRRSLNSRDYQRSREQQRLRNEGAHDDSQF